MTKQVTKPVVKTAPKPVVKTANKTAVKAAVKHLFLVAAIARPQAGSRLYAHTVAAMTVLGMFGKERPAVPRTTLESVIGTTAVRYHVDVKKTMEEQADRVGLTEDGVGFFRTRGYSKEDAKAFEKLFRTGDGEGAKIKAQHIAPATLAM